MSLKKILWHKYKVVPLSKKKGSLILNINYYETQSSSISDYDKGCS